MPRDAATHALKITAPGYAAHEEPVRFDESQRLVIPLRRAPGRRPPTPRPDRTRIESESPY